MKWEMSDTGQRCAVDGPGGLGNWRTPKPDTFQWCGLGKASHFWIYLFLQKGVFKVPKTIFEKLL